RFLLSCSRQPFLQLSLYLLLFKSRKKSSTVLLKRQKKNPPVPRHRMLSLKSQSKFFCGVRAGLKAATAIRIRTARETIAPAQKRIKWTQRVVLNSVASGLTVISRALQVRTRPSVKASKESHAKAAI